MIDEVIDEVIDVFDLIVKAINAGIMLAGIAAVACLIACAG